MIRSVLKNEKELAEKVLKSGFENGFSYNEALAVAKYYRHILGYGDRRVRKYLEEFCCKNDVSFFAVPNVKIIRSLVKRSNNGFDVSETLVFRKKEIDTIAAIPSFRFQKILLGLLAVAKISRKDYVPTSRWADVKRIISKNITTKDMIQCVNFAYRNKLIGEPSDRGSFHKLMFVDTESEPIFTVNTEKDLLELVKIYEKHIGGEPRYCILCGEKFVRTSRKQNLCKKHSLLKKLERYKRYNRKRKRK